MDVNLTGRFWGWPFNLTGHITKPPEQLIISLIDVVILIFSIIFIYAMLTKRHVPLFGGFWYHQEPRPISSHEGERFLFRKIDGKFDGYKPTHDRDFWSPHLELYGEILSPLKEELLVEGKMANWMLAISGGALVLLAANLDKILVNEYKHDL